MMNVVSWKKVKLPSYVTIYANQTCKRSAVWEQEVIKVVFFFLLYVLLFNTWKPIFSFFLYFWTISNQSIAKFVSICLSGYLFRLRVPLKVFHMSLMVSVPQVVDWHVDKALVVTSNSNGQSGCGWVQVKGPAVKAGMHLVLSVCAAIMWAQQYIISPSRWRERLIPFLRLRGSQPLNGTAPPV